MSSASTTSSDRMPAALAMAMRASALLSSGLASNSSRMASRSAASALLFRRRFSPCLNSPIRTSTTGLIRAASIGMAAVSNGEALCRGDFSTAATAGGPPSRIHSPRIKSRRGRSPDLRRGDSLSRIPNPESRIPNPESLLHLDRQRRQSAVGELGLGRGQFGGGAVRPQAHAVDGLALDHGRLDACVQAEQGDPRLDRLGRSEEHTSELQSLMRISYAVFCLTKKN